MSKNAIIGFVVLIAALGAAYYVFFVQKKDSGVIPPQTYEEPIETVVPEESMGAEEAEKTQSFGEAEPVITEQVESETKYKLSRKEIKKALSERGLGDPDADVVIREHSSFTCSHCGTFHKKTFKPLKEKYIDAGKVYLVFSDFPLNGPALHASVIARCLPEDKYFSFVQLLFETQDQWAFSQNYKNFLKQNAQLAGLKPSKFEACFESDVLREGVLERMRKAQKKHEISSTPTFVVNGETKITGAQSLKAFEKALNPLLD